jgi:two-component system aerobic respiration control sensor histidine kinase ArcB
MMETTEKTRSQESVSKREAKILLVEDHPLAAKIAKNILSHCDCQIDIAVEGKEALKLLETEHYDLIFMDIGLPNMDGYEVAKRIRSHPLTSISHIPIVALTAHTERDNQQRCLDAKINAVFSKPLTLEKAKNILGAFISIPKRNEDSLEKVVDFEYAKKLLGGNEIVAHEMLHMFVDSLPQEVERLTEGYQQKNWETLSSIAHKLKGGSSYCGTLRLKAACIELESYIESGLSTRITELYQQMVSEIEALQAFIKDACNSK